MSRVPKTSRQQTPSAAARESSRGVPTASSPPQQIPSSEPKRAKDVQSSEAKSGSAETGPAGHAITAQGKKAAILDVAARLFAEIGYADCEMGRLAAELGIAKGTLYLYFTSKEELFCACVDAGMRHMQHAVQAAAERVVDPVERISRAVRAYLEFFEQHPEQVELLIQERANFKHRKRPTFFDYREAIRARWRPVYAALQAEGRVRADLPVDRMLENVGNLLYGTMFTNHFAGRNISLDEQHSAIMSIILNGILSPPASPT